MQTAHAIVGIHEAGSAGRWSESSTSRLMQHYIENPSYVATRLLAGLPPNGGGFGPPRLVLLPDRDVIRELMPDFFNELDAQEALPVRDRVCSRTPRDAARLVAVWCACCVGGGGAQLICGCPYRTPTSCKWPR